jgi:hypothetical protein
MRIPRHSVGGRLASCSCYSCWCFSSLRRQPVHKSLQNLSTPHLLGDRAARGRCIRSVLPHQSEPRRPSEPRCHLAADRNDKSRRDRRVSDRDPELQRCLLAAGSGGPSRRYYQGPPRQCVGACRNSSRRPWYGARIGRRKRNQSPHPRSDRHRHTSSPKRCCVDSHRAGVGVDPNEHPVQVPAPP